MPGDVYKAEDETISNIEAKKKKKNLTFYKLGF